MMTFQQAAIGRDITPEALRQAMHRGKLPVTVVAGKPMVTPEDVDAYLASRDPKRVKAGRANGGRAWSTRRFRETEEKKRQRNPLPTPQEILNMTGKLSLEEVTARDLMAARGIKLRRSQEILAQVRAKAEGEKLSLEVGESQHERVLRALDRIGGSASNPRELMEAVKADGWEKTLDDLVATVWSLQKRGLVTFIQRRAKGVQHGAHAKELTNITLTRRGVAEIRTLQNRELQRTWVDEYVENAPEIPAPVIDDENQEGELPASIPQDGEGIPADVEADTPTEYPEVRKPISVLDFVDMNKYPLISDIAGRKERIAKYEAAAELLQDFEEELVISLLEKIRLSPLEQEVLAFLEEIGM